MSWVIRGDPENVFVGQMKKEFWEERRDRQGATLFIVQIEGERRLFFGLINVKVKDKFGRLYRAVASLECCKRKGEERTWRHQV